jgi:hypothetical protein
MYEQPENTNHRRLSIVYKSFKNLEYRCIWRKKKREIFNFKQLITLTRFIPKIGILSVPVKKTFNL